MTCNSLIFLTIETAQFNAIFGYVSFSGSIKTKNMPIGFARQYH